MEAPRLTLVRLALAVQRFRFRAEVGGTSVTVFMTERGVSHVILVWHHDA